MRIGITALMSMDGETVVVCFPNGEVLPRIVCLRPTTDGDWMICFEAEHLRHLSKVSRDNNRSRYDYAADIDAGLVCVYCCD